jgi:hypothetical protein
MRFVCPCDPDALRPEACLDRQLCWDEGEHGRCNGSRCVRFVLDIASTRADRLREICRMEQKRLDAERQPPPAAIGR